MAGFKWQPEICPMANAIVSTVRPKARATPTNPMPSVGKPAANTAAPHPPNTSQKVPKNSAKARFLRVMTSPLSQTEVRFRLGPRLRAEGYHNAGRIETRNVASEQDPGKTTSASWYFFGISLCVGALVTNASPASRSGLSVLQGNARLKIVSSTYINPANPPQPRNGRALAWLQSASAEVWLKFLLALAGLGMAFGAALLSTASGEAGNVWTSVILASLALLMATFVGLVTVPYLARRVAVERLRQTFHYEVTKSGVVYVLVTLVIGIAALNTGNNLLYIVVAAMLAAILVSGLVSAMGLRSLELEVRLPEHVFAGRPVVGGIVLRNPRRFLPSFSIRVLPARKDKKRKARKQWRWERTTFVFPLNRAPENQWVRLRDWKVRWIEVLPPPPGIFEGMIYFPYLPPGSDLTADLELCFERRGLYRESSFGVATRFPFAFLTKTRDVALEREILVYPTVEPPDELFEILPLVRGEWESFVRGRGSDLYRIREYMPEDSARHVDWKATAKSGSLKVREFSREDERKLCIVFDNPAAGFIPGSAYEQAVNLAASLAWHFSTHDAEVSFVVPGHGRLTDLHEFLAQLAVIEPQKDPHAAIAAQAGSPRDLVRPDVLRQIDHAATGEYNIVLTARPRGSLPTALWNCSYFIFLANEDQPTVAPDSRKA